MVHLPQLRSGTLLRLACDRHTFLIRGTGIDTWPGLALHLLDLNQEAAPLSQHVSMHCCAISMTT